MSTNASSNGIGGTVMNHHNGLFKPAAYVSITLTDTNKHYTQVKKELVAMIWYCEIFVKYLIELNKLRIIAENKPLILVIDDKDFDIAPGRYTQLLMRLMRFTGIAEHILGKSILSLQTCSPEKQ